MDDELVYNNLDPGQLSRRDLKRWPRFPALIKGKEKKNRINKLIKKLNYGKASKVARVPGRRGFFPVAAWIYAVNSDLMASFRHLGSNKLNQ